MIRPLNNYQVIDRREWLTISEAAVLSKYSKGHVRELARKKAIDSVRLATLLLIGRASLMAYRRQPEPHTPANGNDSTLTAPASPLTLDQWMALSTDQRRRWRVSTQHTLQRWIEEDRAAEPNSYDILAVLEANRGVNMRNWKRTGEEV